MNAPENEFPIGVARSKRQFPDHAVDAAYPVGWPVYTVRLTLTVLTQHEISTVARYILRLASLGPIQPTELGRLLSLSSKFVAGAAAELLGGDLIVQHPDLHLEITEQGRQTLAAGGLSWSPKREHISVPFEPLTRRVLDIETRDLMYPDMAGKNGLFVLPPTGDKPRPTELRIEAIRDYARMEEGIKPEEIAGIAEVHNRNAQLRYRNDITVVKLAAPGNNHPTFAAFRGREYLEEETTALQRLAESGVNLVPEEYASNDVEPWTQSRSVSRDEANLLAAIKENDRAVAEAQATRSDTQSERERAEQDRRIAELDAENASLRKQLGSAVRLIKTEEHHSLLLEAIDRAQSELTLVSAWIGQDAFDSEVCRKLRQAMARGVQVRIAWGLGTRRGPEADRNRAKGDNALSALRKGASNTLLKQLTVNRTETHEKFIICDDQFCAWGSFNWLSYRGKIDNGYRRETSLYSERPDDIALWKDNAAELFR